MQEYVQNIKNPSASEYGIDISNLFRLYSSNVDIETTIVISNKCFIDYKNSNRDNLLDIENVSKYIFEQFNSHDFIDISVSLYSYIIGIPNLKKIPIELENIKASILLIFDSWFDNKAKAYRISYSIPEENTFPAIYIQPNRSKVDSFVTRCPKTGQITNQTNIDNIHNTVKTIRKKHEELLFCIEKILKAPMKFEYFTENNHIIIRNVENELMTNKAKWNAINDLFFKGLINKEDYINLLEPQMIFERSGIKPISESGNSISKLKGLPASPGMSLGRLVFSFSDISSFKEDSIFCCIEQTPEDLEKLDKSIGGISARGGMTSHLAKVSREIGKPAVTGAPFKIDYKRKELIFGNKIYQENSFILIDGNKGEIFISNEPIYAENNYRANSSYEYLKTSYELIKSLSSSDSFKDYSIDFQFKIANLLSAFNKIEFSL